MLLPRPLPSGRLLGALSLLCCKAVWGTRCEKQTSHTVKKRCEKQTTSNFALTQEQDWVWRATLRGTNSLHRHQDLTVILFTEWRRYENGGDGAFFGHLHTPHTHAWDLCACLVPQRPRNEAQINVVVGAFFALSGYVAVCGPAACGSVGSHGECREHASRLCAVSGT